MTDDTGIDIGQLSPDQQAALEQYTAVTAQDVKDAVPLLERSQWNVQVCTAPPPLRSHSEKARLRAQVLTKTIDCHSQVLRW